MQITIKSIAGDVVDTFTKNNRSFVVYNWQVKYDAIFPEAELNKGYHSLSGIIGWKGDPKNMSEILNYIKSFYK